MFLYQLHENQGLFMLEICCKNVNIFNTHITLTVEALVAETSYPCNTQIPITNRSVNGFNTQIIITNRSVNGFNTQIPITKRSVNGFNTQITITNRSVNGFNKQIQ